MQMLTSALYRDLPIYSFSSMPEIVGDSINIIRLYLYADEGSIRSYINNRSKILPRNPPLFYKIVKDSDAEYVSFYDVRSLAFILRLQFYHYFPSNLINGRYVILPAQVIAISLIVYNVGPFKCRNKKVSAGYEWQRDWRFSKRNAKYF